MEDFFVHQILLMCTSVGVSPSLQKGVSKEGQFLVKVLVKDRYEFVTLFRRVSLSSDPKRFLEASSSRFIVYFEDPFNAKLIVQTKDVE